MGEGGGWVYLLQIAQQFRGLFHMVGLWLTQAVQDSIEGFLIQQVPLRQSRAISSLPRSPPETHTHLRPRKEQHSRRPLKVETQRDLCWAVASVDSGAERTAQRGCRAASQVPPHSPNPSSYLLWGEVVGLNLDLGAR